MNKTTTIEVVPTIRDCSCCANAYKCGKEAHAETDSGTPEKTVTQQVQEIQERSFKNFPAIVRKLSMIANKPKIDVFAFKRSELSSDKPAAATDAEDAEIPSLENLFAFKKRHVEAREIT